jgi:long-chain acyl-CoA synthetase
MLEPPTKNPVSLSEYFDLLADARSLPELFFGLAEKSPVQNAYSQFTYVNTTREVIQKDNATVVREVKRLAEYLISCGVKRGDRVAICSGTRPEWMIADLAILSVGAVSVSIYQTLNKDEMAFILLDSGASFIFLENQEQFDKTLAILDATHLYPALEGKPAEERKVSLKGIVTFEEVSLHPLAENLQEILAKPAENFSLPELDREDLASIVYTSGTTGFPKGVVQTHGNHLSNLFQATRTELFALDGDIFLFLPLAHSFARLIGYIGFLSSAVLRFPAVSDKRYSTVSIPGVMKDLREAGANVVPCVPRILEKIKSGIEEKAAAKGIAGFLLRLTIRNALQHYHSKGELGAMLFGVLRPIRQRIRREIFGERFEHVVSGGAKLPVNVCDFFLALECTVYQGYGLTETCVATNVNLRDRHRPGSVGPTLYGLECKIAEDGEILFRGPNVAKGYWNRPQSTAEAWDPSGFFHTGDLGRLDEDGFLWITGRKKEIIVSSTGKKVVPGPIEESLTASGKISQAVLIGDERSYCVALLVPNMQVIEKAHGKQSEESLRKLLEAEVANTNRSLSKHEEIKKFAIIREEFTVDNGLLTPTLKIRRNQVAERYQREIAELYA